MALQKKTGERPEDAVILTEHEAVKYHSRILHTWDNVWDTFAYKYGCFLLGGATVMSSMYINNYFRMKFKVLHYGRMSSYIPICLIPGTLVFILHQQLVLKELILLNQETCPICIELRASVVQGTLGCLLPLTLAPASAISLAHSYGTYNVPYILKQPLEVWKVIQKQIKPARNTLLVIFGIHAVLASVVTYFEAGSVYKVNHKLMELEQQLERDGKI
ncbi:hypothetical protein NQ317_005513 [Molorchus minor]|uniref:Transmembrane protein 126A n=1 Tax=Molorchus minor TaxID=1323400 RepID=A0ABQ9IWG7_9CUCU|nr:hypothetical protein NQ317_005513 [Molorchus minor]